MPSKISRDDDTSRIIVRPLQLDDHNAIVALQQASYPDIAPWTKEQLANHIQAFPEGQLGITLDDELVATSASMIVYEEDYSGPHTYEDVCPGGLLTPHTPDGDSLYGIDIVVSPKHRGMRLARRLYGARKQLVRELNLQRILIGGRMPRYRKHADRLTPAAYLQAVLDKERRDPVITAQRANGFTIRDILYGYLPSDVESGGNALMMEWHNPDFRPLGRRALSRVRVTTVQYRMRPIESFEEFARQVEFFTRTASGYKADFLLFPEMLTNQLLALIDVDRPALAARELSQFTERYEQMFTDLAMRYSVNIIGGTHLTVEDGTLYNVASLFHRDGRIDRQKKLHITPAETRWWGVTGGDRIQAFETDRGRVGITICYDVEFPELSRILRDQGAQILFVPYNTDLRTGHIRVRSCAQARCIENHLYAVLSGACGNMPQVDGSDIHYAHSAILTPSDVHFVRDGIAAETTPNVEMMLVQDLDLDLLRRSERQGSVRPWLDRRPDLYQLSYTPGPDDTDKQDIL
jgi:predicted amidohydrolase/ribosomal protein S18 acetylase RimI-like enzyme